MFEKKIPLDDQPTYWDGQLLMARDFTNEQEFLLNARHRQNLGLHGWGVARGLEVTWHGDKLLGISAGFAIDEQGREVELEKPQMVELHGIPAGSALQLTLACHSAKVANAADQPGFRIERHIILCLKPVHERDDVPLARLEFDDNGHLSKRIDLSATHRRTLRLRPGIVTVESLAPALRTGWVSLPFHAASIAADRVDENPPPPFRVGATQALSFDFYPAKPHMNERGGGGTMAIPLPPGIRALHRFRIAGADNKGKLTAVLYKGGIKEAEEKEKGGGKAVEVWHHDKVKLCTIEFERHGSYSVVKPLDSSPYAFNANGFGDDTLAVEVRATAFVRISLVAVEVSY